MGDVRKPELKKRTRKPISGKTIMKALRRKPFRPDARTKIKLDKEFGGTGMGENYGQFKPWGLAPPQGATRISDLDRRTAELLRRTRNMNLEDRVQRQEFRGGGMVGRRGKDRK